MSGAELRVRRHTGIKRAAMSVPVTHYGDDPATIIENMEERALIERRYLDLQSKMSRRVREVWELRKRGLSYKSIAQVMGLSVNTVEQHMRNAYAQVRRMVWPCL